MKPLFSWSPAQAFLFVSAPFVAGIAGIVITIEVYCSPDFQSLLPFAVLMTIPSMYYWVKFANEAYAECRKRGFLPGHLGIIKYGLFYFCLYMLALIGAAFAGINIYTKEWRLTFFLIQIPALVWWIYLLSFNGKALLGIEQNERAEKPGSMLHAFAILPLSVYYIHLRLNKALK